MFSSLYEKVLQLSAHKRASDWLAALSAAESIFFPIPPDVMLIPMTMAKREKGWYYAALTTIFSVLGGLIGYAIGAYAMDMIQPWLEGSHYWPAYLKAVEYFKTWGFWVVLMAGFSPIPYKVFTITAGALSVAFVPFLLASLIGRGGRFFLVAGLIILGGERMEKQIRRHVETLGWLSVVLFVFILAWWLIRA